MLSFVILPWNVAAAITEVFNYYQEIQQNVNSNSYDQF